MKDDEKGYGDDDDDDELIPYTKKTASDENYALNLESTVHLYKSEGLAEAMERKNKVNSKEGSDRHDSESIKENIEIEEDVKDKETIDKKTDVKQINSIPVPRPLFSSKKIKNPIKYQMEIVPEENHKPRPFSQNKIQNKKNIRINSASQNSSSPFILRNIQEKNQALPQLQKIKTSYSREKFPIQENDREIKKLEGINNEFRNELKKMNNELTLLLEKKLKLSNNAAVANDSSPVGKSVRNLQVLEKEKQAAKRFLNGLINEYNCLSKKFFLAADHDGIEELRGKYSQIEQEQAKYIAINKELEKKIKSNECDMKRAMKRESISLIDNQTLDYKNELYKIKIRKLITENERLARAIEKEEERYNQLVDKYNKFVEIMEMNEDVNVNVTPSEENEKNVKELKDKVSMLNKKKEILSHSHEAMTKSLSLEIEGNSKYIEQLNVKIKELDSLLSSM